MNTMHDGHTGQAEGDWLFTNAVWIDPGKASVAGWVRIHNGRIEERGNGAPPESLRALPHHDCGGNRLTPGLIDVHTHGLGMQGCEAGVEALDAISRMAPRFGVTSFYPTLVPQRRAPIEDLLDTLSGHPAGAAGADVPGLHLEGPFMALAGAACDTRPGDVGLLDALLDAARGRIAIMSLSPEAEGVIPVIEHLVARGVRPFMTHTRASVSETEAAIRSGACHATHFYDVFPIPAETDPGVRPVGAVEAILADPAVTVDFIADGCHVHPVAIRAALAAKGWQGLALISDSNIGAGLDSGVYDTPWGYPVRVATGCGARVESPGTALHGQLAGSALTMDEGMRNLLGWLPQLPDYQVWAMGTATPARIMGLSDRGRLLPGCRADLVEWDANGEVLRTWIQGTCQYDKEKGSV